jgi:hypothetical protein
MELLPNPSPFNLTKNREDRERNILTVVAFLKRRIYNQTIRGRSKEYPFKKLKGSKSSKMLSFAVST